MGMQGLGIPLDQVPAVKENQYRLERVLITALTCRMLHKVTTALFDQITILVYEINPVPERSEGTEVSKPAVRSAE